MTIALRHRGVVSRISRGAGSAIALALALLVVPVSAAQSGQTKSYKVLYRFHGEGTQGGPTGLVRDAAGILYGTTEGDGAFGFGTVFEVTENGKKTVLHSFAGHPKDGAYPVAGLLRDATGNLYGTTSGGGVGGNIGFGTIFKIDMTGTETVLYSFTGGSDGRLPQSSLVMDAEGNLYGTTTYGGNLTCNSGAGCGLVFKLDASGKESVLYSFTGRDGASPVAGLVRDDSGNLYGTTAVGGGFGYGTVFELSSTGKERLLHSFAGPDGEYPVAELIRDDEDNLYGTTKFGGTGCENGGCGTVFKLAKTGKETVVHSFAVSDGAYPDAGLVRDDAGNLYGTTQQDGPSGFGTLFKLNPDGDETLLHAFAGGTFAGGTDGANPLLTTLIRDPDGNLYGTTFYGGGTGCDGFGCGTVYKLYP